MLLFGYIRCFQEYVRVIQISRAERRQQPGNIQFWRRYVSQL